MFGERAMHRSTNCLAGSLQVSTGYTCPVTIRPALPVRVNRLGADPVGRGGG